MIQAADAVVSVAGSLAVQEVEREKWFALYTKSRHEKILERELSKKGLTTFLPLRSIIRHWSDRKKIIQEPLFKSYLFVRMNIGQRLRALNSVGAVRFVNGANALPLEVPDKDIEAVKRFSSAGMMLDPFPYLKKGERVYIRSGPFKGVEGFIVYKNQQCRLVISLDVLMQSISVEVDQACVEKI